MGNQPATGRREAGTSERGFRREIGYFGSVSVIAGILIGSGIFYIGGVVLERVGMSFGLAILCWCLGGVVTLLGALCYAELAASMPQAGGSTVYLNKAYHPLVGFLVGFGTWTVSGAGSIAALSIALPTALQGILGFSNVALKIIAVAIIFFLSWVNYMGIRNSSLLQICSMVGKLVPIGVLLIAGLIAGGNKVDLSMSPAAADGAPASAIISMIAFGVLATLWAFDGWKQSANVTEEMKNPSRDFPLALITSIIGITVLYALFNFAVYRVLPVDEVYTRVARGDYFLGTQSASRLFGNFGVILVTIGMVLAIFNSANGCIMTYPRQFYAMAEEGHFFKSFKKLHPKHRVPHYAIWCQAFISSLFVIFQSLSQLTTMVAFMSSLENILLVIAIPVMRKKYPDMKRPYKVWGGYFTVALAAVLFLALVVNTFVSNIQSALIGMSVPIVGTIVYFIFDVRLKKERSAAQGDKKE